MERYYSLGPFLTYKILRITSLVPSHIVPASQYIIIFIYISRVLSMKEAGTLTRGLPV